MLKFLIHVDRLLELILRLESGNIPRHELCERPGNEFVFKIPNTRTMHIFACPI